MGRNQAYLTAFVFLFTLAGVSSGSFRIEVSASQEFPVTMPLVFVDPQNASIAVGETLTVTVNIFNLTDTYYGTNTQWVPGDEQLGPPGGIIYNYSLGNLYGFDIEFSWNPTVLQYASHSVDGVLHDPTLDLWDRVDGVEGTYKLVQVSSRLQVFNNPGENSTVFTMTFEVVKEGMSELNLGRVDLATLCSIGTKHRQMIPHVRRGGGIYAYTAVPEFASLLIPSILVVTLAAVIVYKQKRFT